MNNDVCYKGGAVIRKAGKDDASALAALATELWDSHNERELLDEFRILLGSDGASCFVAYAEGELAGFAQCQLRRDYVEGARSSPTGYLEGIYVRERYRRLGLASRLLEACEAWARARGCGQFASDCELGNADSLRFHMASGFEEANRIICFIKEL